MKGWGEGGVDYSQFLFESEQVAVDDAEGAEQEQEEQEFAVDEFVEAASPLAEETRESAAGRRGHLVLVADRHGSCSLPPPRTWRPPHTLDTLRTRARELRTLSLQHSSPH